MKKVTLNSLNLNSGNTLTNEEKKKVIGGADHYEIVCFYCPERICVSIRVGIDPEPC